MPLAFFKLSPSGQKVVFLPDHLFFVRVVPVDPSAPIAPQIELALENLAPFSLGQLFYGWFQPAGAGQAMVFAAYRKRFTVEQTSAWAEADMVLPAFVAGLGAGSGTGTPAAVLISTATGLTGLAWDRGSPVPVQVVAHVVAPDATDEERAVARTEVLHELAVPAATELSGSVEIRPAQGSDGLVFALGAHHAQFSLAQLDAMDVRDKTELAQRGRGRRRDLILWRTFAGALALIGLSLLLEFSLVGGRIWQKSRDAVLSAQSPSVQRIENSQQLSARIEELAAKRLMPFEMMALINQKRPHSIYFKSVRTDAVTDGLYKLTVNVLTGSSAEVDGYVSALRSSAYCAAAEVSDYRSRDGLTQFTLVVTFKPEALRKPAQS